MPNMMKIIFELLVLFFFRFLVTHQQNIEADSFWIVMLKVVESVTGTPTTYFNSQMAATSKYYDIIFCWR